MSERDFRIDAPIRRKAENPRRVGITIGKGKTTVIARAGRGKWAQYSARPVYAKGKPAQVLAHPQKVVVRLDNVGTTTRGWGKYGRDYLSRDGVSKENEQGKGFDEQGEVQLGELMRGWQKSGDDYFYHVVVSPEGSHNLDLPQYTREVMARIEGDLGQKLQWGAIDHYRNNTGSDHPHVHVVIRGRDEQGNIALGGYLEHGAKEHAQEIATNHLGYRLTDYDLARREKTLGQEKFTETDKSLWMRRDDQNRVRLDTESQDAVSQKRAQQEQQRLGYLEEKGLATKVGDNEWEMYHRMNTELRFRATMSPDWKPKEAAKEQAPERTVENRQHLERTIDDDERTMELER